MALKEGHQIMLMGTADVVALPTEKIIFLEDMTDTQKAAKVSDLLFSRNQMHEIEGSTTVYIEAEYTLIR